ncbi:MAG: gamma-glutamyl-gamma-aminobutyrate hydrolase family protein, partial [Firmicutes bacterium]|nr:gamma-glutamyl-gamma-aminobutyrate hydrolase family protein [Bacillota bacterium]
MRPVIGITCCYETEKNQYQLNRDYVDAVHFSGGIPLILPHYQDAAVHIILEAIDGLLLSGGGDIDPALFCEEPWPENGDIDPHRDTFELALTAGAIAAEMPVLGICRGIQVINVAGGGSVCQDIGRVIQHPYKHDQQAPRWHPTHGIHIKHDSRLFDILGQEKLQVNSFHHQMVGTLARGFKITASSGDGVTEALEQQ